MVWVISFTDTKKEYLREEILDSEGCCEDYGKVLQFTTREKAEDFRLKNTDSHNYDFEVEDIFTFQLNQYEDDYNRLNLGSSLTKSELHEVEMDLVYLLDNNKLTTDLIINKFTNLMARVEK